MPDAHRRGGNVIKAFAGHLDPAHHRGGHARQELEASELGLDDVSRGRLIDAEVGDCIGNVEDIHLEFYSQHFLEKPEDVAVDRPENPARADTRVAERCAVGPLVSYVAIARRDVGQDDDGLTTGRVERVDDHTRGLQGVLYPAEGDRCPEQRPRADFLPHASIVVATVGDDDSVFGSGFHLFSLSLSYPCGLI